MQSVSVASIGELPFSPDDFKRAILRPPPKKFSVVMLAPTKKGGNLLYGLRVIPSNKGDRSSTGSDGSSSRAFSDPYEIWRKWEDCLYFQDQIEEEYGRLARIKRQRLVKGKGVKKNGMYMQDAASSWDSLPPGPDPNSIAQDVHNLIPRLSQKGGSLFGNKQAIVDLRVAELSAFISALFKDDVPALLLEVRSERIVTDFFGYWQRDQDLLQKNQARLKKHRQSTASSILSFYAGPSPHDDSDARSISSMATDSSTSPSRSSISSRLSSLSPRKTRRPRPLSTSSDSSSGSSPSSAGSVTSTSPSIAEDVPIVFNHNPRVQSHSSLQPPPADTPSGAPENIYVRRVKKRSSRETLYRRSARIFSTPPTLDVPPEDDGNSVPPDTPRNNRRESWQTIDSARTYLEGLDMTMPSSPTQIYHSSRLSIGSIATIMTTCSADAVIPHDTVTRPSRPILGNRRSRPVSILSVDGSWSDGDEEMLDAGLFDEFPMPAHLFPHRVDITDYPIQEMQEEEERSETPLPRRRSQSPPESYSSDSEGTVDEPSTPTAPDIYVTLPPSPACSTFSDAPSTIRDLDRPMSALSITSDTTTTSDTSFSSVLSDTTIATTTSDTSTLSPTSPSSSETYTIKAAHNQSIILLRVPKSTPFPVLRTKIYEKFAKQEKVLLSDSFTLAFVIPDVVVSKGDSGGKAKRRTRERSSSMSSAGGPVQMALVTSQDQWERVTQSTELSKITLRVLDTIVI